MINIVPKAIHTYKKYIHTQKLVSTRFTWMTQTLKQCGPWTTKPTKRSFPYLLFYTWDPHVALLVWWMVPCCGDGSSSAHSAFTLATKNTRTENGRRSRVEHTGTTYTNSVPIDRRAHSHSRCSFTYLLAQRFPIPIAFVCVHKISHHQWSISVSPMPGMPSGLHHYDQLTSLRFKVLLYNFVEVSWWSDFDQIGCLSIYSSPRVK